MGLRPEHIQEALLVNIDSKTKPLAALTDLINLLLSGKAHLDSHEYFAGARLCALQKGEQDIRPIAVGETIRRIASKAACAASKAKASTFFQGQQYGVATAAGAERMIHLCRQTVTKYADDTDFVLCKVDLSNAFNNVSRSAFLSLTQEHFPNLSKWVEWCYETESYLTFGQHIVHSAEGVQQGDPLGPLLFSLVIRHLAEIINAELPEELFLHVWYLDDGVLAGKAALVKQALDIIAREGQQLGLLLNTHKCELILKPPSAHRVALFPEIPQQRILRDGNFSILGSPVGSAQYCSDYLREHALAPALSTLSAIKKIDDPQVALTLIRQCSGFCQLVFSLRATPTKPLLDLCSSLDTAVIQALEDALCSLNPPGRVQAQSRKEYGGFGLHSSSLFCSAAYVSSVSFAASQDGWDALDAEGFREAMAHVNELSDKPLIDVHTGYLSPEDPESPPASPTPPKQQTISRAIAAREFYRALEAADQETRARWLSQSGEAAANWAFVLPSKELGYALTPTEFRALARWWLGADVYDTPRPCPMDKSNQPLGSDGQHALACKSGYGLISRHNALVEHFCDVCTKAHLAPQREVSLGNHGPGGGPTRPGDVFLPNFGLATGLVLDFCVTHVQQPTYTNSVRGANVGNAGSFAERYATAHKRLERLEAESQGYRFTAMAVESFGSWSESARGILREVAERRSAASQGTLSRGKAFQRLLTEMNVTLMRAQARMLVLRMPAENLRPSLRM